MKLRVRDRVAEFDPIKARLEVGDGGHGLIGRIACQHEMVEAGRADVVAGEPIEAWACDQDVVAGAATHVVGATKAADERVGPGAAKQPVLAVAAVEYVVAGIAGDDVTEI